MDAEVLQGAFVDPARASQSAFRALLNGLAEPGTIRRLGVLAAPPAPLPAGVGTVLLTLCDADTPIFIDLAFGEAARRWAMFHTGAPTAERPQDAAFAVVATSDLSPFDVGSDLYPDRSATLILPVRFEGDAFQLSGPGIQARRTVRVDLPPDFPQRWAHNRSLYPRGVDLILVDGPDVIGLPRTTTVAAEGDC